MEKTGSQIFYVFSALAKRWKLDGQMSDAMKEVLTELVFLKQVGRGAVCRGDQAKIRAKLLIRTEAAKDLLLQDMKEQQLSFMGEFCNLVDK